MTIPDRPDSKRYYYHVYDYDGSEAFEAKKKGVKNPVSTTKFRYSLVEDMKALKNEAAKTLNGDFVKVGNSKEGREIKCLKFGNNDKKQILLTGGVHAREWIAVEIPYLIAEYLIKNYNPQAKDKTPAKDIQDLLDSCEIYVIPMLNPDGHMHSVSTDAFRWRKNRNSWSQSELMKANAQKYAIDHTAKPLEWKELNPPLGKKKINRKTLGVFGEKKRTEWTFYGVDCNRNFAANIGSKDFDPYDPRTENFAGPMYPSEPETIAFHKIAGGLNDLVACIDYHSCMGAIMYPEDSKNEVKTVGAYMKAHVETYDANNAYDCNELKKIITNKPVSTPPSVMGCCCESMKSHKLAFTIELDPSGSTDRNRWFSIAPADIQRIFEKNLIAVLCLIHNAVDPDWQPAGQKGQLESAVAGKKYKRAVCCPFKEWEGDIEGQGNKLKQ